jgi:hypothetical protein
MCRHQQQSLDPKLQRVVAISVARGMAYLHSRTPPILHLVRRCHQLASTAHSAVLELPAVIVEPFHQHTLHSAPATGVRQHPH